MVALTLGGIISAGLVEDSWTLEAYRRIQAALAWFVLPNARIAMFGDSSFKKCLISRFAPSDDPAFTFAWSRGRSGVPPQATVRGFSESGYFVARDRWPIGTADFADCSYLAQTAGFHSRVHKHADNASFVWYDRGHELLADAGRFGYKGRTEPGSALAREGFWYSDPKRIYVESTRAHNAIEIDGRSHARTRVTPYGSSLRHHGEQDGIAFSTTFQWHGRSTGHARVLLFSPGRWVVVVDWLRDLRTAHDYVQRFLFAPELDLDPDAPWALRAPDLDVPLHVLPLLPSTPLAAVRGEVEPELLGWVSRDTETLEPAWTVAFAARGVKSHVFATLLHLSDELPMVDPGGAVAPSGRGGRFRWRTGDRTDGLRYRYDDAGMQVERLG